TPAAGADAGEVELQVRRARARRRVRHLALQRPRHVDEIDVGGRQALAVARAHVAGPALGVGRAAVRDATVPTAAATAATTAAATAARRRIRLLLDAA